MRTNEDINGIEKVLNQHEARVITWFHVNQEARAAYNVNLFPYEYDVDFETRAQA